MPQHDDVVDLWWEGPDLVFRLRSGKTYKAQNAVLVDMTLGTLSGSVGAMLSVGMNLEFKDRYAPASHD